MKLSNKAYDVLKWICQVALPAVIACASAILGLLRVDAELIAIICGIGTAIDTLLGTLLGVSSAQYRKVIDESEGR